MSDFKGRRFPTDVILVCVRWYCKYGISYRDLEEMMSEHGVTVDHTTLFRWVQRYAPLMEKRIRWYQRYTDASWRVDEISLTLMLSPRRTAKSARRFLGKALRLRQDCPPETINTHQNEAYGKAIRALKRSGKLDKSVQHRQVKYLNNRLEADHGALKRLINPARGFKTLPTASATIKGLEVMRMIRKRQCLMLESGTAGEVRFVNRLFRLAA